MKHEIILKENWSDYDNRKIRDNRDKNFFSCEEEWEVNYLIDLIIIKFPNLDKNKIRIAIQSCCISKNTSRLRVNFIECVMSKL